MEPKGGNLWGICPWPRCREEPSRRVWLARRTDLPGLSRARRPRASWRQHRARFASRIILRDRPPRHRTGPSSGAHWHKRTERITQRSRSLDPPTACSPAGAPLDTPPLPPAPAKARRAAVRRSQKTPIAGEKMRWSSQKSIRQKSGRRFHGIGRVGLEYGLVCKRCAWRRLAQPKMRSHELFVRSSGHLVGTKRFMRVVIGPGHQVCDRFDMAPSFRRPPMVSCADCQKLLGPDGVCGEQTGEQGGLR